MSGSYSNQFQWTFEVFCYELARVFALCGLQLNDARAKIFYQEFELTPSQYLRPAFQRIIDNPPAKITAALIKAMLRDVMPKKKNDYISGCEYCETGGTIPYVRVIADHHYQYIARCHKCQTSQYKHLPFYNEVMPHDNIQPRAAEKTSDARGEITRAVRMLTMREAADEAQERYRRLTLAREKEYETDTSRILV